MTDEIPKIGQKYRRKSSARQSILNDFIVTDINFNDSFFIRIQNDKGELRMPLVDFFDYYEEERNESIKEPKESND